MGGSAYQMVADLAHFKVLMTAGKGLTPAQQAWDPRTLELYAQLGIKRVAVACLGQIRAILWADHANVKRLQDADDIDGSRRSSPTARLSRACQVVLLS